ncbi:hypothetical protein NGRA_2458 [Nosema granulosis]|uniref:Integrase zinc-binding domain-containing protein n=1 Tax=Nosema granulosis TaxID=83296 RepID=A0A9P6KY47_9MICR|nr:hypothetical protein NGRA_2458 [Nosema granulosis]
MVTKNTVGTNAEYSILVDILKATPVDFKNSYEKYRLTKKAELFSLVKDKLFYKLYQTTKSKSFYGEQEEEMKIEEENLHAPTHYGKKKMEEMCSKMYFSVPRRIVRQLVNACLKCTQALPFKQPCSLKHVTTERTFERFQMDLVGLLCRELTFPPIMFLSFHVYSLFLI